MIAGARKVPEWESELWSYVSMGDGETCPLYSQCEGRQQCHWCPSDNKKEVEKINRFIDDDEFMPSSRESSKFDFIKDVRIGRIFTLVRKLAKMYFDKTVIHCPPVIIDLVSLADDNRPIEVHLLPLKAYHGAIWRMKDAWVIQLNKNDTLARQRFTLFHEFFHILAHCRATPVFRKRGIGGGSFNEALADHFATVILTPEEWLRKKWPEVKDVNRMAEIFEVPRPVIWLRLKALELIQ